MTHRLQNMMLAMLLALTTLFVGIGALSQNPTSGGYHLFERAASGISADIPLASLGSFAQSPETVPEYANAPNTAGGTADAVAGAKLNRELLLDEVVDHSFYKHVLQQGEFKGLGIRTRNQFREHVNNVIENPSGIRYYKDGRSVYLQEATGTVVVRNPTGSGQSTAFQPKDWNAYISTLPKQTTPYQ